MLECCTPAGPEAAEAADAPALQLPPGPGPGLGLTTQSQTTSDSSAVGDEAEGEFTQEMGAMEAAQASVTAGAAATSDGPNAPEADPSATR